LGKFWHVPELASKIYLCFDYKCDVNLGDNILLDCEINVGNRLLIFVTRMDDPDLVRSKIPQLVQAGKHERDDRGFNRFRLVLLTTRPRRVAEEASSIFHYLGTDEKVHLHVIDKDDFPASYDQTK